MSDDFRFFGRPAGAAMGRIGDAGLVSCGSGGSVLLVSEGTRVSWDLAGAECLAVSSPMVIFRMAIGMRLTRRSIRERRSAHWRA
jgi:hypothetical protein